MKALKLIIVTILLFVGNGAFAQTTSNKDSKKKVDEVTFSVHIDCQGCVNKIKKNIPYEKGVKNMKVDVEKKLVWIAYNPKKTNPAKLLEAFKKIGEAAEIAKNVK